MLIDANQAGLLLLAQIGGGVGVANDRKLHVAPGKLRNRPGNQVVMLDVADRRIGTDHLRHLPGIATRGIDHLFGNHPPLLRDHFPLPGWAGVDGRNPVVANDSRTHLPGAPGHGVAEPRRVGMAVVRRPGAGQHAVQAHERMQFANLAGINDLHGEAHAFRNAAHGFEPIEVALRQREANAPRRVPTHELAGDFLKALVE